MLTILIALVVTSTSEVTEAPKGMEWEIEVTAMGEAEAKTKHIITEPTTFNMKPHTCVATPSDPQPAGNGVRAQRLTMKCETVINGTTHRQTISGGLCIETPHATDPMAQRILTLVNGYVLVVLETLGKKNSIAYLITAKCIKDSPPPPTPTLELKQRGWRDSSTGRYCYGAFEVVSVPPGRTLPFPIALYVMDAKGTVLGSDNQYLHEAAPGTLVEFTFRIGKCSQISQWRAQGR